jgi:hypothetical protein
VHSRRRADCVLLVTQGSDVPARPGPGAWTAAGHEPLSSLNLMRGAMRYGVAHQIFGPIINHGQRSQRQAATLQAIIWNRVLFPTTGPSTVEGAQLSSLMFFLDLY